MKKLFAALGLALALLGAGPARAYDTPLPAGGSRMMLEKIAKTYQHYAGGLGCPDFAWGNASPDNAQFTLKYLPKGTSARDWVKMVIITVNPLKGDKGADTDTIAQNIQKLESQYKKMAAVTQDENYMSMQQELMLFMQYSFGKPPQTIYGAAAYLRTSMMPAAAAFIQLQSRAGPLPPDEALQVQRLVNATAKLPEKPKEK